MPLVNITVTSHTENRELVTLKEHRENSWKIFEIMAFCSGVAIGVRNYENRMQLGLFYF